MMPHTAWLPITRLGSAVLLDGIAKTTNAEEPAAATNTNSPASIGNKFNPK